MEKTATSEVRQWTTPRVAAKLVDVLVNALLVLVIGAFLSVFLLARFSDWDLRAVLTGSMTPTFKVGGVVLTRPVEPASIKVGDPIMFTASTANGNPNAPLITHRVVSVEREGGEYVFKTKGDANQTEDRFDALGRDVRGKVVLHVPFLGYILDFFQRPLGFILAISVAAGCLIFSQVRKLVSEVNRVRREAHEGG